MSIMLKIRVMNLKKIGIVDDFLNGCVSVTPLPSDGSIIK